MRLMEDFAGQTISFQMCQTEQTGKKFGVFSYFFAFKLMSSAWKKWQEFLCKLPMKLILNVCFFVGKICVIFGTCRHFDI